MENSILSSQQSLGGGLGWGGGGGKEEIPRYPTLYISVMVTGAMTKIPMTCSQTCSYT